MLTCCSFALNFVHNRTLCSPSLPCCGEKYKWENKEMHFYEKDEKLPLVVAILMGFQHCFAMAGGIITPPFVIFQFALRFQDPNITQYAISAALIVSGICTFFTIYQWQIPFSEKIFGRRLVVGTGVLSAMGTSFTFLPICEAAIGQMKLNFVQEFGAAAMTDDVLRSFYGKILGTVLICSPVEIILSFVPIRYLRKVFTPLVTGVTVILIGASLVGTGMKYWGGGVVCAEYSWTSHASLQENPYNDPPPVPGFLTTCTNGFVKGNYGSIDFLGLGFSVMAMLVFIEVFGSAFMKNCNVVIALIFGYFVAAVASGPNGESYVDTQKIADAPWLTFLWVYTFPLGIYAPAVIPLLVAFFITTVETVGDIGATYEASELDVHSVDFEESIQGGLLADGLSSMFAAFCTTLPNTTFSQNNGVIALTKCASRYAGYAAACWLLLLGVVGKIAGIITSVPDCVIGGMTIFLFANVAVSGIGILATEDLTSRRARFIAAFSLAIGLGVTVWPWAFADPRGSPYTANFWTCEDCSETMRSVRDAVSIVMSTGYCIGAICAIILNGILPSDAPLVTAAERKLRRAKSIAAKSEKRKTTHGGISEKPMLKEPLDEEEGEEEDAGATSGSDDVGADVVPNDPIAA
jgi:uracil-xanthine permease